MEKDTHKTKVIFRKYKDGDILALFPELQADSLGNCGSYQHVGQHGAANYNHCMRSTRRATVPQYQDLKNELESIGYNLLIRKRR